MELTPIESKQDERTVGTRYPLDRIGLLDVVAIRWKKSRADVIEAALDELLVKEGLLDKAA